MGFSHKGYFALAPLFVLTVALALSGAMPGALADAPTAGAGATGGNALTPGPVPATQGAPAETTHSSPQTAQQTTGSNNNTGGSVTAQGNYVGTLAHALPVQWIDPIDGKTVHYDCVAPGATVIVHPETDSNGQSVVYLERGTRFTTAGLECKDGMTPLNPNLVYQAKASDVKSVLDYSQAVVGVMAIPYKYYTQGDKTFAGNSSLAGYFGVRFHSADSGVDWTFAGFAGTTTVSVPSTGTTAAQSISGFSYGGGWFFSIGGSLQAGLVVGKDYVSNSAKWVDNGKLWMAVDFGYQFL